MTDLDLTVGSQLVYPHHGVAVVERVEQRVLNGEPTDYLVLRVPSRGWETTGDMLVALPVDRAAEVGVRAPIGPEEAEDVLHLLRQTDVRVPSNWSRRFKNHAEKLRSGEVYGLAEVVRNLALRARRSQLSEAEKRMYARARQTLLAELALSWVVDDAAAEARLDEALGGPADG